MATRDFTIILCSLIMSLDCIIEENRKENNMNTEMFPSMWCPRICNSKNSSNSRKSFSHFKIFLRDLEMKLICSTGYTHTLGNVRLNFSSLTFTFIMNQFCALSITRCITTENNARWIIVLGFAGKSHVAEPVYHKQAGVLQHFLGTADPKSLESLNKHLNFSST